LKTEDKIREHLKIFRAQSGKTQKQMAAYLGVSYVTYQEMEKGIVKSVKGLNLLKEKTGFRTQENEYNKETVERKADVGQELNRLIELSIKHEAEIEVLRVLIVSILAVQKGKESPLVEEEVIQAMKMRADRLFYEYSKKK
jgi:DNA-binding XRE family transcriptional regulator